MNFVFLARRAARFDGSLARGTARFGRAHVRRSIVAITLGTWCWLGGGVPGHAPGHTPRVALLARASAQAAPESLGSGELPPAPPAPAPEPVVPAAASAAPTPPPAPVQTVKTTQDAALLTPPPPPGTHIATASAGKQREPLVPASEHVRDTSVDAGNRDPMNWLGLTVKFGYAWVASGTLNNPTYNKPLAAYAAMLPPEALEATGLVGGGACTPIDPKCRTAARSGFQFALALHIGGGGLGFDVEPYLTKGGNAFAAGAYFGPRLQLHLARAFYLGIGLGARAAYVALDGWKNGGDVFGRIPLQFTYYVARNFALVLEGAFGAGMSLFVSEPVRIVDPRTNRALATAPKIAVGASRGWDITFGLRFP
jgi:hypothetical protein